MSDHLPYPGVVGPPWAKITPARWGFYVTHGIAPLSVTETGYCCPKRWWRRTQAGAERKAQRLIDQATASRVDHGWSYEPPR